MPATVDQMTSKILKVGLVQQACGEDREANLAAEGLLRTLVNARSVAVRDCARDSVRLPDVISFDVPSAPWTMPARLEAVFESTRVVTESQLRTLSVGAQIASLLVQIECATGGGARFRREDGAAPLIGSSAAIHAVRERIERVAMTDFTVPIERGFGPEPHAGFVGVSGEVAVDDGYWKVEGATGEQDLTGPRPTVRETTPGAPGPQLGGPGRVRIRKRDRTSRHPSIRRRQAHTPH